MKHIDFKELYSNENTFHSYQDLKNAQSYSDIVLSEVSLPRDPLILDCASGAGFEAEDLKVKFGGKIIELDISTNGRSGKDNQKFVQADINALPFPNNRFDFVHIKDALIHCEPDNFFSETSRVLKPGGQLLVVVNCVPENRPNRKYFTVISDGKILSEADFSDLNDFLKRASIAKMVYKQMGYNFVEISPPYFANRASVYKEKAKQFGLDTITLPTITWQPRPGESNWGDFKRNIFLFKKSVLQ